MVAYLVIVENKGRRPQPMMVHDELGNNVPARFTNSYDAEMAARVITRMRTDSTFIRAYVAKEE